MPCLFPTASEILKRVRGNKWTGMELVVVAGGGIKYALVGVNRPVSDGQHRTSNVPWKVFRGNFTIS